MKELSIEEKAKAYDEAIEVAKRKLCFDNAGMIDNFTPDDIREIFPELKESEDEKWIPKEIAKYLKEKGDYRSCWIAWLEKQNPIMAKSPQLGGQKSAWSEEDEKMVNNILTPLAGRFPWNIYQPMYDWLKALKGRVGCEANCTSTKEWSVEDKSKVQRICKYLDEAKKYYADIIEVRECMDWLKSLEDRYTWKPSEKQMEALKEACDEHWEPDGLDPLYTLYQELKKLREK